MRMPPLAPMPLHEHAAPGNADNAPMSGRPGCLRASREAIDDAHAVAMFLRAGLRSRVVDPAQTLWVVDLAPGDGERAWRVLRELAGIAPRGPAIRYLAACEQAADAACLLGHPRLAPLIADGALCIDRDGRGMPLHPIRNPLVVLAHDAFTSRSRTMYVCRSAEWMVWDETTAAWSRARHHAGFPHLLPPVRSMPDSAVLRVPTATLSLMSMLLNASAGRMLVRGSVACIDADAMAVDLDILARWHRANGACVHQSRRGGRGRILHIALHEGMDGTLRACLPELMSLPHPDEHADFLRTLEAVTALPSADWPPLLYASGSDPRALRIALRDPGTRSGAADCGFSEAVQACRANAFDPEAVSDAPSGQTLPVDAGLHRA